MQKSEGQLSFSISVRAVRNILIGFIAGAMLTSGVAFAATNSNKYTGCLTTDGTLHKIAQGKKPKANCVAGETKISWNNKGKRGKKGVAGPAGETGPRGLAGPQGLAGPAGADGQQGPQGEAGQQGETGPQGPAGIDGEKGDQGLRGATGLRGSTGSTGQRGPKGEVGATGRPGSAAVLPAGSVQSVRYVEKRYGSQEEDELEGFFATCANDEVVLGGGHGTSWTDPGDDIVVLSRPFGKSWYVQMIAEDEGNPIWVHAICAKVTG